MRTFAAGSQPTETRAMSRSLGTTLRDHLGVPAYYGIAPRVPS